MESEIKYQFIKIASNFQLHVQDEKILSLSEELNQIVDSLWVEECQKAESRLFDGSLLSALTYNSQGLFGGFISYKVYLAWLRLESVRQVIQVHPVGITGITWAGNRLLLGRRSSTVAHYPEMYECAPTGGVDALYVENNQINYIHLLFDELSEETGLPKNCVLKTTPKALCERIGPTYRGVELLVEIEIDAAFIDQTPKMTPEYSQLLWLRPRELVSFIQDRANEIVPTSQQIIERILGDPLNLRGAF